MEKNRKRSKLILPGLVAVSLYATALSAAPAFAEGEAASRENLHVYEIDVNSGDVNELLKKAVIEKRASEDVNIKLSKIDIAKSTVTVEELDTNKSGIQDITATVQLVSGDNGTSVSDQFTEKAAVKLTVSKAPILNLKADEVTVNNGDAFNPNAYISYVSDESNVLPVIRIENNVDMSTDGTYTAVYTAVDVEGNSTQKTLTVNVKTPQEVIEAREAAEAAKKAEEEAEAARKAEAEKKAKEAAEQQAQLAALAASGQIGISNPTVTYTGANPYYGGWSNCTWGAWQALYQSRGITLPNLGNACSWLYNAAAYGYATGTTPAVGAIAVYSNHVAYVDAVNGDSVHIIEGGYCGHYNERWVSAWSEGWQALQGYIYP